MAPMHRIALNVDLSAAIADGAPPEWVEMIPAGPEVTGRDGRTWIYDDAAAVEVINAFIARGVDLPIDWNHALQLAAPQGGQSPASAWIHALEQRAGALWARVTWTAQGASDVVGKNYRYLSPVFDYDPATGRIARLVSAALTNTPNLRLPALNSETTPQETTTMVRSAALTAAITGALGLNAEASDDAVAAAITTVKATALNSEHPPLDRFVPRADHDAVLTRAANAEQKLADFTSAQHETAVNAEIEAAMKAGKISPATVDYHRASCSDAAGLQRFRDYIAAAPVIVPDAIAPAGAAADRSTALNAEETYVANALGLPVDTFKKEGR